MIYSLRPRPSLLAILMALTALPLSALPPTKPKPEPKSKTVRAASGVPSSVLFTVTTPATLFFGQSVDGYAQVAATDNSALTGTVIFYDGTVNICAITVEQTTVEQNTSCPATIGSGFLVGRHALSVVYSGDQTHTSATSTTAVVTILPNVTTALLTTSTNPAAAGQSINLTASLHGSYAIPSGLVTFLDGSAVLGTATLDAEGDALLTTSSLTAGTHTIGLAYTATQSFTSVTAAPLNQVITSPAAPTSTSVMLASSINPAIAGHAITLTATVVSTGTPSTTSTGVITFLDSGTTLGTAMLDPTGLASLNTSSLATGSHSIAASYAGDSASAASTSASFLQLITTAANPVNASFVLGVGSITIPAGSSLNVPVKVAPINGFNQAIQLHCANLPSETTCVFATDKVAAGASSITFKLTTLSPRDCGSATSYNQSASNSSGAMPYAAPLLAGVFLCFLPGRRRTWRGLLAAIAMGGFLAITGCSACTDLGTRPGSYTLQIIGTSMGSNPITITQNVQITVTP